MNTEDNLDKVTAELEKDSCPHLEIVGKLEAIRMGEKEGGGIATHHLKIMCACADCGLEFHFVGVDQGQSFRRPMASNQAAGLLAPIAPGPGPLMNHHTFEVATPALQEAEASIAEETEEEKEFARSQIE